MDYYVNEFSLDNQFANLDAFFTSLREKTIPLLEAIQKESGSVIWESSVLGSRPVCTYGGKVYTIFNISARKNVRDATMTALKSQLSRVLAKGKYWTDDELAKYSYRYDFAYDKCSSFSSVNCFTKAAEAEGSILSFEHPAFQSEVLCLFRCDGNGDIKFELDNFWKVDETESQLRITNWRFGGRYIAEVRAKEFEYHSPHFHVQAGDCSGVFSLKDGMPIKDVSSFSDAENRQIKEWYLQNREALTVAWDRFHPLIVYKKVK